jgi:hypothetical protein
MFTTNGFKEARIKCLYEAHGNLYVNSKLFIQCSESTGSTIVADAT